MKCPTCNRSARSDDQSCRRCGTDLDVLHRLARIRDDHIESGHLLLLHGMHAKASDHFGKALAITRNDSDARKGLALSELLQRNYRQALLHYLHGSAEVGDDES